MGDNDVKVLEAPYFEIEYLDDNNTKHFGAVKTSKDLEFMKERFTVLVDREVG